MIGRMTQRFYSGTSNLLLPVKNKNYFPKPYQDKTRLTYYASMFPSVEINSSFYRMPLQRTMRKWADEVPDDFRFTFKLIGEVTHSVKQTLNLAHIPDFLERISGVGLKKGCLLIQLPPSFTANLTQLRLLLETFEQLDEELRWPIAVEFRHASWYNDKVFSMLHAHSVVMVLQDMAKSASPIEITNDSLVYLRFHGPESGYRGSYDDDFLAEYASFINEWLDEGKTVYAYFNNSLGNAVGNLQTLNNLVFG